MARKLSIPVTTLIGLWEYCGGRVSDIQRVSRKVYAYDVYLKGGENMDAMFVERHAKLKATLADARAQAAELVKSREGSLIVTKIEEALLWLHAAKAVEEAK